MQQCIGSGHRKWLLEGEFTGIWRNIRNKTTLRLLVARLHMPKATLSFLRLIHDPANRGLQKFGVLVTLEPNNFSIHLHCLLRVQEAK